MSVVPGDCFKSKTPLSKEILKSCLIDGGRTKITEKVTADSELNQSDLAACIALHVTPEGRVGQAEFVTFGGPVTLPFTAKKAWPNAPEELELIITINDLNNIVWPREKSTSSWIDYKDNRVSYRWISRDPLSNREDSDALDDQETEDDINCSGWSVRLNL